MKRFCTLVLGFLFVAFSGLANDTPPDPNPFASRLAAVPKAELPAKAAAIVKNTAAKERVAVAVQVVKAALAINPAAAPAIVGTIARTAPETAAVVAGTAARLQPKQAVAITRAAVAAAPTKIGDIVAKVCEAVPNDYRAVALAAAKVAPEAGKEILNGVAAALPDLKDYIEKTLAAFTGSNPSVASVLDASDSTDPLPPTNPRLARGPAIGPPYIPLSSTPTNVPPGNSGEVPPGGRDYAAP